MSFVIRIDREMVRIQGVVRQYRLKNGVCRRCSLIGRFWVCMKCSVVTRGRSLNSSVSLSMRPRLSENSSRTVVALGILGVWFLVSLILRVSIMARSSAKGGSSALAQCLVLVLFRLRLEQCTTLSGPWIMSYSAWGQQTS